MLRAILMVDPPIAIASANDPCLPVLLLERATAYATASKAANTWRAYQGDWRTFEAWCAAHRLAALPAAPETVALYLTHQAERGRKVAGIARALVLAYRAFVDAFRYASAQLQRGNLTAEFPPYSFPPRLPYRVPLGTSYL